MKYSSLLERSLVAILLAVGASCASRAPTQPKDAGISLSDYQAAFARFESCVANAGDKVVRQSVDPQNGIVSFSIEYSGGQPSSASSLCSEAFKNIDAGYARLHPPSESELSAGQLAFFRANVAPCLKANKVDFVMPTSIGTPEWARLNDKFVQLNNEGKCPGSAPSPPAP